MTTLVDINADLGESFGIWKLGNDEEFMPFVSSVNIACGWHAGDPHIMRRSVELALEKARRTNEFGASLPSGYRYRNS